MHRELNHSKAGHQGRARSAQKQIAAIPSWRAGASPSSQAAANRSQPDSPKAWIRKHDRPWASHPLFERTGINSTPEAEVGHRFGASRRAVTAAGTGSEQQGWPLGRWTGNS